LVNGEKIASGIPPSPFCKGGEGGFGFYSENPVNPVFQVRWRLFCGSGFPAATIEAESLSHKKTSLLADKVPAVTACQPLFH
jgi:hypothetical protein